MQSLDSRRGRLLAVGETAVLFRGVPGSNPGIPAIKTFRSELWINVNPDGRGTFATQHCASDVLRWHGSEAQRSGGEGGSPNIWARKWLSRVPTLAQLRRRLAE